MIIPEIMPGELGMGYLLRLRDINGYQSTDEAICTLRELLKAPAGAPKSEVAFLLSSVLKLPSEQFCRYHTLLPIMRAVTHYLADVIHGDPTHPRPIRTQGNCLIYKEVKFCHSCVKEDLDYWGFAYFRRDHQLPGMSQCSKHLKNLSSSHACHLTPDKILPLEELGRAIDPLNVSQQEVVRRYLDIVESWAMAERPIPVLNIVDVLQSQAKTCGIRWSKFGNKQLFSDLVLETCSRPWLKTLIPNLDNKLPGQYFSSLDGLLVQQKLSFRSTSYALALSILFDNAEEAVNAAYACVAAEPRAVSDVVRLGDGFWSGNRFLALYSEHRGNSNAIAKAMDHHIGHTKDMMSKNGFPSLRQYSEAELHAFREFHEGISLGAACSKHNVNQEALERLLRSASYKLNEIVRSFTEHDRTGLQANVQNQKADHESAFSELTPTAIHTSSLEGPKAFPKMLRSADQIFIA